MSFPEPTSGSLPPKLPPKLPPNLPPRLPHAPANPASRVSVLAVSSLVCGIAGILMPFLAVTAIILGCISRSRIRNSGGSLTGSGLSVAGIIFGSLISAVYLTIFVVAGWFISNWTPAKNGPGDLYPIAKTPVPLFPELPKLEPLKDTDVLITQVELKPAGGKPVPGSKMTMRIYVPAGKTEPNSIPCVLVAPAGTNLLTGNSLDPTYHTECLPYANAGMAVICYSLDGNLEHGEGFEPFKKAFKEFNDSAAGVINGRNALEFALSRLPMVDRTRIYAAGHSSAGTVALLFAAHEPRLRGCLAYAPAGDVEEHMKRFMDGEEWKSIEKDLPGLSHAEAIDLMLPGFAKFIKRSSPLTHASHITAPVFLFHAEDDQTVPFASGKKFATALQAKSSRVTFSTVSKGGHYFSMVKEGIPQGIEWMRALEQESAPAKQP